MTARARRPILPDPRTPILHSIVTAILYQVCGSSSTAAEVEFRRHDINPDSTYSACAAVDANGDGMLDVICGAWWYEAPTWKRHFVRSVEKIRGRFDGYSSQPFDVNGDGWPDIIEANYRSSKLAWIEHPGKKPGGWIEHVVARPGAMETGRLVDVDGDGTLDLLPNGARFAAWWEIKKDDWLRHDLPDVVSGHGIGFGDLNGDGRGDVVASHGWLEAPTDQRHGEWLWHPEFELGRASIPIFVFDVDGDGDSDIVWGLGHQFGLYWLEQAGDGQRQWVRHAIDTSWSQPHAPLLADLDGDGNPELVAGKRYMAHDGGDPGAYDPLVIYWYRYDRQKRSWRRGQVSSGARAGFGLDPKAIDLDGDGDLDLIAPGRSGLYWFENLILDRSGTQSPTPTTQPIPEYADHSRLAVYADAAGDLRPVKTPFDWGHRRADIRAGMEQAMGPFPETARRIPLEVEVTAETATPSYVRKSIKYTSEAGDRVPAYLLVPRGIRDRAPAMLCLHQTVRIGKDEPAGLGGRATLHYAHELAQRGYVCIVPDYPSFGDYAYDFKNSKVQARYASGSMKAIWNNVRAVDVLEALPMVNRDRIGCIGHSLGGHNAMFTAVFDQRLRAIVSSCGFTAFHDYYGGKLAGWTSDRYMPRIREVYQNDPDRVPFDFHEVVAAFAPRAFFVNAPISDSNFDVDGVRKVIAAASQIYELRGVPEALTVRYPKSEHDFPDSVRLEAYAWLDEQLRKR